MAGLLHDPFAATAALAERLAREKEKDKALKQAEEAAKAADSRVTKESAVEVDSGEARPGPAKPYDDDDPATWPENRRQAYEQGKALALAYKDKSEDEDEEEEKQKEEAERQVLAAQQAARADALAARATIVRGQEFQPFAPRRYENADPTGPVLTVVEERDLAPPPNDTQGLLNTTISELNFLMREVAFRSICHAANLEDRQSWVGTAIRLAVTCATVGKAVGRVCFGPDIRESTQRMIIEKREAAAGGRG